MGHVQPRPGILPRQLAKQLAPYGIKSKTVRVDKYGTPKGYELSQFDDAFARYLDVPSATAPVDSSCDIATGVADQGSPPEVTATVPNPDASPIHADVVEMLGDDLSPPRDPDVARLDEESVY